MDTAIEDRKPARTDLALPVHEDGFRHAQAVLDWFRSLWEQWPCKDFQQDDAIFLTYLSLLFDTGLPSLAAVDAIAELAVSESTAVRRVRIRALRFDDQFGKTTLFLSKRTRLAVRCWKGGWRAEVGSWQARSTENRTALIEKTNQRAFNRLRSSKLSDQIKFSTLSQVAPIIAMRRGFDAYSVFLYSGRTRPTDQEPDDYYQLTDRSQEFQAYLVSRVGGSKTESNFRYRTEALADYAPDRSDDDDFRWRLRAKGLLRRMCAELVDKIPKRVTGGNLATAKNVMDRYQREAESFANRDSALIAAIEYAKLKFLKIDSIESRTLRTYLDRCVINGLLISPGTQTLSDWDPDDFFQNFELRISRLSVKRNSLRNVAKAYKNLFVYLSDYLKIPGLRGGDFDQFSGTAAGQWQLIAPGAIDSLTMKLVESEDWVSRQAGLAIALGYYGGLRISEVRKLTCASIVFSDRLTNLDIEILSGKSASARRRLPLDVLAPVWVQEMLRQYVKDRIAARLAPNVRKVALLGLDVHCERFTQSSFSRLVHARLKEAFGFNVTFHTLRHCFCSNLFIRWYGLRHEDVFDDLRIGGHELFQERLQRALRGFFTCHPIDDGETRPYDLISMIKLSGHASPVTFFRFYVHSGYLAQEHAVSLADTRCPPECPPNRVLRLLVPKRASPGSLARMRREWEGR